MECTDTERQKSYWIEEVEFNENYDYYREFFDMLSDFKDMWDGDLARIITLKHRINLISLDVLLIHLPPYRAGPRAREFKRHEIYKWRNMNFI